MDKHFKAESQQAFMRFAVNRQPVAPPGAAPAWARESLFREVVVQVTFFALYLLLDRASTVFRMWAGTPAWYLPSGIALATLIWGGWRYVPVFLAASLSTTAFNYHQPLFSWAGIPGSLGPALSYVIGAVWLRSKWHLDQKLRSLRDIGGLVLFLILFGLPAALMGVLSLFADGFVSASHSPRTVLDWWVSDSISITSFTPFLLLYVGPTVTDFLKGHHPPDSRREGVLRRISAAEGLELAAELASIAATLWLVLVFKPAAAYQPLYLLLLPVIWMAVRHGFARASLGVLAINLGVIAAAHITRPDPEGLSRRQLLMLALALTGLCLGAVIGERRQAGDALRLSEEKFARAFHSSPAALSISTLSDGRLLEVNDTFLRLFEYDRREVIGKTSLELNLWVDPEERSRILDALREHGKVANHERRHRSSSGRVFTVLSSIEIIEVQGAQRLLATFVDITQTKEAQQALRESEQRYRDFVTHSHEGVWRLELERPLPLDLPEQATVEWLLNYGYIAECNLAFARMQGYSSPEELVGRHLREALPPADSDLERLESFRLARDGFRNRTTEFRGRDKTGKVRNLVRTEIPIVENGFVVRVWGITRDVTEQKQAEEARAYLSSIVEFSDDAILGKTCEGVIQSWNNGAERLYGYTASEMVGESIYRLAPPDRFNEITSFLQRIKRGEAIEHHETVRVRKDGELIDVSVTVSPIREAGGRIIGASAVARNITERKQAEDALRESEERFRATFENAGIGMGLGDVFGHSIQSNRALQQMLGYTEEELRSMAFTEFTHPDDRELDWNLYNELAAGRRDRYQIEKRNIKKDGQVMWAHLTVSLVKSRDGAPKYAIGMVEDITERKRAEEAQRESEERFRTTFENAGIGMAVVDLQGHPMQCNPALERMLGYSEEELLRMSFAEFTHPEDRDVNVRLYRDLIEGKRDSYQLEKRYIRKDGQIVWGFLTVSLVKDAQGRPQYGVGMAEDITERKRAEDGLRKLNAELEQRVMERTQQLDLTNRELEVRNTELSASNQELEAFSYSVAHDLRAPLRQIQGFSHLLRESHSPDLAPEAHRYIRNIIEGAQHMGRLIDHLLDLSRLGRRSLNLKVTAMATLVEDARRDLAREIDGRDVCWQIGDLPLVECDAALMRQVLVNLISNALKYTQGRQPAVIKIGQMKLEGAPVVFVKDNGVGFNMKYADKLFGVFQRLHRREEFDGTGIGLATVKRIIEKHGGRVWAEGEVDKGATFFFALAGRWEGEPQEETRLTARPMNAAANSS